jgi:CP family cyanate transporter-like MFS transporter
MVISAGWIALPLGLLVAPGAAIAWILIAGMAQGATYTMLLTFVSHRAPNLAAARKGSAIMQAAGDLCAAITPTVVGALSAATGGWTIPLAVILGLLTMMTIATFLASRETA